MQITNIREAKTHLSKLIARVMAGEEIIIGKAGKPVAKIVPYQPGDEPRRGTIEITENFDELPKALKQPSAIDGRTAMRKLCQGLGKGPKDLGTNHDHYLYGSEKKA